ncbi:GGDEF domain-containing protein [Massilia sp. IC2-476]|uniref:GGDEF domain-containing protein n=1 Tax=Massilia sp. IC2-476 TaxID=2887199 RepID=UPI001D0F51CF|nr:GGDEF domain-containing protein [Massilia sp. IC2-476]MCC2972866.1 GGDEF domain-containing protein [Massilia sp. IC2-476]
MRKHTETIVGELSTVWSCTSFGAPELSAYAAPVIAGETRRGVALLSVVALLFLLLAAVVSAVFNLGAGYTYTYSLLSALALHIYVSSARVEQLRALYLLAMLLLVVCGSALVLLAQRVGQLHTILLLSVAVLIMLVPVVPWGVREAAMTLGAIYLMFTASTWLSRFRFAALDLWVLQCLMLTAAMISLALVGRALSLRKHDLSLRFELERTQRELTDLANRDHLTGSWNRRHMEADFTAVVARHQASNLPSWFGLFDIDRFKSINDSCGHATGDEVLRAVHAAFGQLSGDEYLARLGGDEFALLMCGDDVPERVARMLASVEEQMRAPLPAGARVTVSLGLLRLPTRGCPAFDAAYRLADELLYDTKRAGGNGMRIGASVEEAA